MSRTTRRRRVSQRRRESGSWHAHARHRRTFGFGGDVAGGHSAAIHLDYVHHVFLRKGKRAAAAAAAAAGSSVSGGQQHIALAPSPPGPEDAGPPYASQTCGDMPGQGAPVNVVRVSHDRARGRIEAVSAGSSSVRPPGPKAKPNLLFLLGTLG